MSAILITGGTGQLGSHVAKKLVDGGEEVVCFDLIPTPARARLGTLGDKVKVLQGDVTRIEDLVDAVKENNADRIIHLSRYPRATEGGGGNPYLHKEFAVNAFGTNCVFEAARLAGARKVIYASSTAIYGSQEHFGQRPISEEDHGYGDGPYAVTKALNEAMARAYHQSHGMELVAIRPALVFGPDRFHGMEWANQIATFPAQGKPIKVPMSPESLSALVYVDDAAEAIRQICINGNLRHSVYNIVGYSAIAMEAVRSIVRTLIPYAQIAFDPAAPLSRSPYIIDNTRMVTELGVKPRSLAEAYTELIDWTRTEAGSASTQ